MSEENNRDLEKTKELFELLQGNSPEGHEIKQRNMPKLTANKAWTVIWYLGNQDWKVTDRVDRCDMCGDLYHSWQEGHCLDFGRKPYNFCDGCMETETFRRKKNSRANPDRPQHKD